MLYKTAKEKQIIDDATIKIEKENVNTRVKLRSEYYAPCTPDHTFN